MPSGKACRVSRRPPEGHPGSRKLPLTCCWALATKARSAVVAVRAAPSSRPASRHSFANCVQSISADRACRNEPEGVRMIGANGKQGKPACDRALPAPNAPGLPAGAHLARGPPGGRAQAETGKSKEGLPQAVPALDVLRAQALPNRSLRGRRDSRRRRRARPARGAAVRHAARCAAAALACAGCRAGAGACCGAVPRVCFCIGGI